MRAPTLGGEAYDPSTGRLYVSVTGVAGAFNAMPVIEVFQVTTSGTVAGSAAVQIGTLSGAPYIAANTVPLAGAVPAGTPIILTAGNVYDLNAGGNVTQVAFYLDTNGDGIFETGTDALLGDGSQSTLANASHDWNLTISTTGLAAGTYDIFAVAKDASGYVSAPIAWTLTIQ